MQKKKLNYSQLPNLENCTIAIIGLGYVGLPLAVEFAKRKLCLKTGKKLSRRIIGYDVNIQRIEELSNGNDKTNEIIESEKKYIKEIEITSDNKILIESDVFIITVPTPIDYIKRPNLNPIIAASKQVGETLKKRKLNKNKKNISPIVIVESTVYPGLTEEICVPIIESESKLKINETSPEKGFFCGYSPERINPGDKMHTLTNVTKVTSGSDNNSAIWIDNLYSSIIKVGTFKASTIKVAEAAKVIENTQRDLNIALMNELSIIFKLMEIDTLDVIEAASTKWNFLKFKPGLVGGHCIGVDPYYLTHKSETLGYSPEIVLAGRKINDSMSKWIADQIILEMIKRDLIIKNSNILILGITFKENCPDLRNSKIYDLVAHLTKFNINTTISDPHCNIKEAEINYKLNISKYIPSNAKFSAVILAVKHKEFLKLDENFLSQLLLKNGVIFDLKGILKKSKLVVRF